jgi:hypothetical protein
MTNLSSGCDELLRRRTWLGAAKRRAASGDEPAGGPSAVVNKNSHLLTLREQDTGPGRVLKPTLSDPLAAMREAPERCAGV